MTQKAVRMLHARRPGRPGLEAHKLSGMELLQTLRAAPQLADPLDLGRVVCDIHDGLREMRRDQRG